MHRSSRSIRRTAALGSALAAAALAAPASAAAVAPAGPQDAAPAVDVRAGERAPLPPATRAARDALAQRLGTVGVVATEPVSGGIRTIGRSDGYLTAPSAADPVDVALGYVRDRSAVFGLDADDRAALRLTRRYRSGDGVTHLTWVQTSDDLPAYDSVLNANVSADGRLVNVGGNVVADLALPAAAPALSPSQALATARAGTGAAPGFPSAQTAPGPARRTTFANGDRAQLVAFAAPGGDRLAWRLTVAGAAPFLYDAVVDARSGELLARHSLTDFAAAQVYENHPGATRGGAATTVDLAADPAWLNDSAGGTRLSGRNAHAYADVDGDSLADPTEEVAARAGPDWLFPLTQFSPLAGQLCSPFGPTCTWDGVNVALTEPVNRAQTTTQLFWLLNRYHDWLAGPEIGFTAASGNFEDDDRVQAESDDGGGFNNANMSTPPDGTAPRMQMYLFRSDGAVNWPAVNAGDDASVVEHEYTHGLSNRLVGGGTGIQLHSKQSRAMGEGWSDWYALDHLVALGLVDDPPGNDGDALIGAYVTGNVVTGIRREALDCPVGSTSLACTGTASSGPGGYTYADLGRIDAFGGGLPRFEEHDDGEIWGQTLWDLRGALGGQTARTLITNAMRLTTTPNPSFLDERDAILQADLVAGGTHRAAIWQVFAVRGMGYGARTTGANATRAAASFATPALTAVSAVAVDDGAPLGDGDGIAEPGESVRLGVQLDNPAAVALTNVRATLTPVTSGVTAAGDSAAFGTIPAGERSASLPFAVTFPPALQCGAQVAFTLQVGSDQGAISLPLTRALGGGSAIFAAGAASLPLAIPDGDPGSGVVSALTVPSGGRIDRLRVHLAIAHRWIGDVRARLTAPSGTTVELLERPGSGNFGSAADGVDVTLSDDAPSSIQGLPDGQTPTVTGEWQPDEPLAALTGQDRAGTWTLRVTDALADGGADVGALTGWSVETDEPACAVALPRPAAGGGGGDPAPGDAGLVAPGAGAPAPGRRGQSPAHRRARPRPAVRLATRTVRLGAGNRFTLALAIRPARAGSVRFAFPKPRHGAALRFGTMRVSAGARSVSVTLHGSALRRLRQLGRAQVTATFTLGARRTTTTFTLLAPRPR